VSVELGRWAAGLAPLPALVAELAREGLEPAEVTDTIDALLTLRSQARAAETLAIGEYLRRTRSERRFADRPWWL
jgi:hypothetical protein